MIRFGQFCKKLWVEPLTTVSKRQTKPAWLVDGLTAMQLISVIYRLSRSYRSLNKISVSNIGQNIGTDIIGDIDRYLTEITDKSPISDRYNRYITELLVLNCYIYKFCIILKLPISHLYLTEITYISNIGP
ncbi:hypothetical protein Hanom_Chr12g01105171 [Helianthus anomalus]